MPKRGAFGVLRALISSKAKRDVTVADLSVGENGELAML